MTKCPYVPPHPFHARFPASDAAPPRRRSQSRARRISSSSNWPRWTATARWRASPRPLINWASDTSNKPMRARDGKGRRHRSPRPTLPKFHTRTFVSRRPSSDPIEPNQAAPAFGKRKAALYATCFVNYNKPDTGMAARAVLNHIGVETKVAYPGCCGMPFLEQAELARVARERRQGLQGTGQADRRGLRHRRADRVLRADAEIRMAADRARQ